MTSLFEPSSPAESYVRWLVRWGATILAIGAAAVMVATYLVAFHLPIHADFSYLLPQDADSVRDLRRLETRVRDQGTVLVVVEAPDPQLRAQVAGELADRARALMPALLSDIVVDDAVIRDFLRDNRHLLVPLADLEHARDALARRIAQAKLDANPLFIDLLEDEDEREAEASADQERLTELRERRQEAEQRLARSGFISQDERYQLVVLRTGFPKTDADAGRALAAELDSLRAELLAAPGRDTVRIGYTGGVIGALAEQQALIRGMMLSSVVTGLLVALVLLLYFRSVVLLMALTASLLVGTLVSFGLAVLTVGHLNAATAFLGAIIAGNGVNYGILLIARFLEERRRLLPRQAMAEAIRGTLRPTIVASLGAAIAYGSLAATSFRGFADFAIIGAIGMALCWIGAFTLLPVLILRFVPDPRLPEGEPVVGAWLARVFAFRHPGRVCAMAVAVAVGCGVISYRYVATDPFEYNLKALRSEGEDAVTARRWLQISDDNFGRGISGVTYIAAERPDQVPMVVDALRQVDHDQPPEMQTIGTVRSVGDIIPADQEARRQVLGEIRALLEDDALEALDADERKELDALRPPADIPLITPERLPGALVDMLRERDGRFGYLIGVRPADTLDEWNGRDLIRFADAIRKVTLPNGETVTTSGPSVIFADIIAAIRNDGPFVTGVAAFGLVVMVLCVVGCNRRAAAVLTATALGSLALVAVCALLGIRVNFLDFVALPITLGLGVDYAVNVAHRAGPGTDPMEPLRTSGSAVFLCSLTTIIGYGSLLVSENLAIRSFGLASLIGEICCLLTALVVVPAMLSLGRSATTPQAL